MNRSFCIAVAILALGLPSAAQNKLSVFDEPDCKPFAHMQVGVTAGTTGVGIEVNAPINKNVRVRAGFSYMPKISLYKSYKMASVGSVQGAPTPEENERRIVHLCEYLSDLVNAPVDEYVKMSHDLSFYNARLLVDWYPFRKKHWHFTGGLYVGPKSLGKAFNALTEANTMVAINQYNKMYEQISTLDEAEFPTFEFGPYKFEMDPENGKAIKNAFSVYGPVAVKLGEFPDGTPHYITPNKDGVMQADADIWVVKPYVGFGWSTDLGREHRWTLSVDGGAMFWGKPHVYCDDGVDLINDVKNVGGAVGNYVKILKYLPFYPNVEVRLAYTIF